MAPMDELVFAPLGGVGEIGMNLGLYGLGPKKARTWLVMDLGMSFAGEEAPGVDLVLPDIRFLEAERKNIAGLVLTHGHEDHIGAVLDLWPRLKCPIYTTRFTAGLLEAKRAGEPGAPSELPITVVRARQPVEVGPFSVEFVPVSHSIPDSHAVAIRTRAGLVLHTGDWKLDPTPVVGEATDTARLSALGDEGVRAIICDSTNAIREGTSPSEADVAASLRQVVAKAKHRVAFTTFSSNVARIRGIAEAAHANGREVVVGRALERVIGVAREQGLLDGVPAFRSAEAYGYLPREKVVAILTGSQGEPRAALRRIADDDHPEIALSPGDLVVFSSRTIPGNEKVVNHIVNALIKRGVEVLTDRTALVHVSGHPRRDELAQMYRMVRPQVAIPVHGEALHLHEHALLARSLGVPEVVTCYDGHVIRLAPGPAERVDDLPFGRLFKDGRLLIPDGGRTIPERRKLGYVGAVSVAVAVDRQGGLAGDPSVEITGVPERGEGGVDMLDHVLDTVVATLEGLPRARRRDPEALAETLERAVRSAVNAVWGKKPVCHVHILEV